MGSRTSFSTEAKSDLGECLASLQQFYSIDARNVFYYHSIEKPLVARLVRLVVFWEPQVDGRRDGLVVGKADELDIRRKVAFGSWRHRRRLVELRWVDGRHVGLVSGEGLVVEGSIPGRIWREGIMDELQLEEGQLVPVGVQPGLKNMSDALYVRLSIGWMNTKKV